LASFDEHINQAKRNCDFLAQINKGFTTYWDWQTTVAFYAAVHLINAHLDKMAGLHYRSHEDVNIAINSFGPSPCKLPQGEFTAYMYLQWLSKRSRYLISEDKNDHSTTAHFTKEKHFARAIERLDIIMQYIHTKYGVSFAIHTLESPSLESKKLKFFKVTTLAPSTTPSI
jgi:hypothetical protein